MTSAPERGVGPDTIASLPESSIRAPIRASSATCMNRFSKIVSRDPARAGGPGEQHHELGLHVGREARVGSGLDIDRPKRVARSGYADRAVARLDGDAGARQHVGECGQVAGVDALDEDVVAEKGPRDDVGGRLDPVRLHVVLRPAEALHALDADGPGSGAFDVRPHGAQERGEIFDLRLARASFEDRLPAREGRRHENVLGAADGRLLEPNPGAAQPVGARLDETVAKLDLRPELLESEDVLVDGPRAPMAQPPGRETRARP